MRRRQIHVHIERLVVDGFGVRDDAVLAQAIEAELAQVLSGPAVAEGLGTPRSIDRVNGGSFRASRDAGAHTLGSAIARAVHRGVTS